ncbi:hypothetical protein CXB51_025720 [Gossypium anomalum]|uniref:Uncharacterized protein n=1 Tax=Gossypium anomalum TaxID=47600 RepID=A0A8J5Y3F9_9ROSI|nr:hypothetical protein CXB51_025720 [Gossypium anomalum]
MSVETQRGNGNGNVEQRRVFPVQSPQVNVRRTGLEQMTNRLPGNRKPTAEIYDKEEKVFIPAEDQTCTVSESSISTSSQTDTELLHSIAESPVLVLDSSFYKEESSPSPVTKRSIDFKGENVGVTSM